MAGVWCEEEKQCWSLSLRLVSGPWSALRRAPTSSAFTHNRELLSNIYSRVSSAWCLGKSCRKARGKLKPGTTWLCFHLIPRPQEMHFCWMAETVAQNSLSPEVSSQSRPVDSMVHEVARRKENYMLSPWQKKCLQTRGNWGGGPETQETALSTKMVQVHSRKCHIQTATCERLNKPFTALWF